MLSIPHLVIIFLVALVVLGPEKLPEVARVLGKVMADFRRITNEFRVQVEDEMRDLERNTRERQAAAQAAATEQAAVDAMAVTPAAFSDEPPHQPPPEGQPEPRAVNPESAPIAETAPGAEAASVEPEISENSIGGHAESRAENFPEK